MDLPKVLAEIKSFLEAHKTRWALSGALALSALGVPRAPEFLELIVEERGREPLQEHLAALGYERNREAGLEHPNPKWGRIEIVYADARTSDRLLATPALRPDHLATALLLSLKAHPEREQQTLADVEALLALPNVDAKDVRLQLERLRKR